jgi:Zn-dependent peptidase ImmA (M78 family)
MINKPLIEKKADELYKRYFKRGTPASRMEEIIRKEGVAFAVRELPNPNTMGVLLARGDQKAILVNNNIANQGRKNFTIAHELGHYALEHYKQAEEFSCDESVIKEEGEAVNDQEKEANYFASCFLLPKERVINKFKEWHTGKQFKGEIARNSNLFLFVDFNNPRQKKLWGHLQGVLTNYFDVSESALKIRLVGLKLVNDFAYNN